MGFERDNIRRMAGYSYGEQPDNPDILKLNTNENPYPPSPEVGNALRAFPVQGLRRYPAATGNRLRDHLAALHGVDRDQIVLTHAGDEALRLAVTTFVDPGGTVGSTDPSYSLYPVLAAVQDARFVTRPHPEDWELPAGFAAAMNDAGAALTCVVNPHAPSGRLTDSPVLSALASDLNGVLLIDEAYVDFVDPELGYSALPLVAKQDNVLLLRTFSKGYALAGLRLGYLIGSAALIEPILEKTRDSYNIDAISQAVGEAAVQDQAYAEESWSRVRTERQRQRAHLAQLGFHVYPSQSNFLLCDVPAGRDAKALYEALKADNILVRYFSHPRLEQSLRISIGTPAENARLNSALARLLS
ncbi:MAG: histidinol-phosphate transaminase [Pseudomonadota bacterium]